VLPRQNFFTKEVHRLLRGGENQASNFNVQTSGKLQAPNSIGLAMKIIARARRHWYNCGYGEDAAEVHSFVGAIVVRHPTPFRGGRGGATNERNSEKASTAVEDFSTEARRADITGNR
jgi:hypothetical protein